MCEVCNFVICDRTQTLPNPNGEPLSLIINPMPVLRPKYVPGAISFSITFAIIGIRVEEMKTVEIRIVAPDQSDVACARIDADSQGIPGDVRRDDLIPVLNFDMRNMDLPSEGEYRVNILLNGQPIDHRSVWVKRAMQ